MELQLQLPEALDYYDARMVWRFLELQMHYPQMLNPEHDAGIWGSPAFTDMFWEDFEDILGEMEEEEAQERFGKTFSELTEDEGYEVSSSILDGDACGLDFRSKIFEALIASDVFVRIWTDQKCVSYINSPLQEVW